MKVKNRVLTVIVLLICLVAVLVFIQSEAGDFSAGFDAEFMERPDGYPGLSEHYNFEIPGRIRQMDPGLMYRAARDGAVDVINAFSTDGRIPAYDLVVLEDDRHFFPPYYAVPLVRKETLEDYPVLKEVLDMLGGLISDEKMQELNYKAEELSTPARDTAASFLAELDLPEPDSVNHSRAEGTVVVGGKHFTEQEVLGELMALLIERYTDLDVERRLNLGGTMICFNALRAGDLDVYVEYTGTALMNILGRDMISDPDEAYLIARDAFEEKYGLIFLSPLGFNNSYTLTMRREHAEELDITTISDLADHLGM